MFEAKATLMNAVLSITLLMASAFAAAELLDPTRPHGWRASASIPAEAGPQPDDMLLLQGIFHRAGRRTAIINGQRVVIGDRVAGAEVLAIGRHGVTLRRKGERVELASSIVPVKTPVADKGDRR